MTCPRDCRCNICGEVWRAWNARRGETRITDARTALIGAACLYAESCKLESYMELPTKFLLDCARDFVAAERGEL